jgi:hypothetical protein
MNPRRTKAAVSVLALVAATGGAGAALAPPAVAASHPLVTMASDLGFLLTSETENSDGSVTALFSNGAETVGVSGSPGITVSVVSAPVQDPLEVTGGAGSNGGPIVTVSLSGDKSVSPDELAAKYESAHRSVVQDAINLGMDPVDAERQFGQGEEPTVALGGGGGRIPGMGAMVVAASPAPVYDSFCASLKSDAGVVKSYACDERRKDQVVGTDWYVEDAFTDSAVSTDTCLACWKPDRLTKIYADLHFSSGNSVTKWTPTSTLAEPSSCRDVTISLSSPKTGIGYSETAHVCSDNFGPHNIGSTVFGSTWNGHEPSANWYEATEGVSIVHSPSGTSAGVSMTISHEWCEC